MTCYWSDFTPQHYLYCERQLCGWLQQPANTWSNIGYLIAALMILRSSQPKLEKNFFFWTTFVLFIGSTFFHLSGTHLGKMLDVGAMLTLSMGICSLSVHRYYQWPVKKIVSFFFTGLTLSLIFLYLFDIGNIPFSLEILIAVILEVRMIRENRSLLQPKLLLLACGIEFVAAIFLLLDITRTWCDPDNHLINGHAVWHLLSALAIYVVGTARRAGR